MIQAPENERPYLNPFVGGIGIGILLFLSFFLVGKGLGASGAMTRFLASVMDVAAPVHTESMSYLKSYFETASSPLDNWLVYMMIGIIIGGIAAGIRQRRMKAQLLKGGHTSSKRRIVTALLGGILVALGARLAGGCTSGLALTGAANMAVAGWVFFLAVFVGGLVVAFFVRREWL